MRTVSRLRLLLCLIYGHRLPSAITPTLCPVETMQAHHKHTLIWKYGFGDRITWDSNPHMLMVDLGGFAPPSRTLFLVTVYAVQIIYQLA